MRLEWVPWRLWTYPIWGSTQLLTTKVVWFGPIQIRIRKERR